VTGTTRRNSICLILPDANRRLYQNRRCCLATSNFFPFFVELTLGDTVYSGHPKSAIFDTGRQVMRWGSKMEWSAPLPDSPKVPWIDDPELGVARRQLTSIEDVLGAEGTIGGKRYRFETILDQGNNITVYGLYNAETNTRTAYGFDKKIFDGSLFQSGLLSHPCADWRKSRKKLFDREDQLEITRRWETDGREESPEMARRLRKAIEDGEAGVAECRTALAQHESACDVCAVHGK
jgi:hypothetical protein